MSDQEPRADMLQARHRQATRSSKRVRVGNIAAALGKAFGVVRRAASAAWAPWDRAYDSAVARPVHAVRVFALVTTGFVLLAGVCWFGDRHYADVDKAAADVTVQGDDAVSRLMSYNFRTVDRQVERTRDLVTGGFMHEYAKYINTSVAAAAKDKRAQVQTSIDHSAIVSSGATEAVMLMLVDQDSETLANPEGTTSTSALRVTLKKEDGKWKVSDLAPV